MASLSNLKEALRSSLITNTCLVDILYEGEVDLLTGDTTISIAEITPELVASVPYLGFSVPRHVSLTPDDPTTSYYKSTILFSAVSHSSPTTTYIADTVTHFFNSRPLGETTKWFRDFSNQCLVNKYSKFIRRYPLNPRRNNHEKETYTELIECEIIWKDCACDDVRCDDTPTTCPIDTGSTTYEIEDCDC